MKGSTIGTVLLPPLAAVSFPVDMNSGAAWDYPERIDVRMNMDATAALREPVVPYRYWYRESGQ